MFTCIVPQSAYAVSAALSSDTAGIQFRPQPKPALTDFGMQPYSHTYA